MSKIPAHKKGLLYLSFTAFLWSSSGLFIKILKISAFQIGFYRSAIAALTVLMLSLIRKDKIEFDRLTIFASIFYAGILICFVLATKMTTAANAIFLQFTAPIYLLVLEPIFLKVKFEKKNLITILITICGMILFFFGRLEIGNIYGNLIAIGSGICFALFSLLLKKKRSLTPSEGGLSSIIFGNMLVVIICFFILYGQNSNFSGFSLTGTELIILLYMGIFQIGISYTIFNEGIKYVSATESMIITTLEAIFNPIWVFLGIGETPSVFAIFGAGIIIAAILWRSFRNLQFSEIAK